MSAPRVQLRRMAAIALVLVSLVAALPGLGAAQQDDRGNIKEFASGSGKTEVAVAGVQQQMSFTVHTAQGQPDRDDPSTCPATGNVEFKGPNRGFIAVPGEGELHVKGRVVAAVIATDVPGAAEGVFFVAENQVVTLNGERVDPMPPFSRWDATDSNEPGGTGDTILLEHVGTLPPRCLVPIAGRTISQGNVNIKAEPVAPS